MYNEVLTWNITRMGKFLTAFVAILLVFLIYVGYQWLGKVEEGKSDGPRIEDLKVCTFVSYGAPCESDLEKVSQDSSEIIISFNSKEITNSVVKIVWEYEQDGSRSEVAQQTDTLYENGVNQFKLERSLPAGWLLGTYHVTAELEGENTLTSEFEIVSE